MRSTAQVYFHYHDATFARRDVVQAPSWMTEKTLEDVWHLGARRKLEPSLPQFVRLVDSAASLTLTRYGLFYCHPLRAWDPLEVLCRS